jgi:hypothetical protein
MEGSSEPQFDLSEYRVISIEDNHKIAIVNLLNNIISSEPLLEDLNDTKSVVWRLGSLINFFDESFISGQNELKIPSLEEMTETSLTQISSYIRHWLISYYNADSVIGIQIVYHFFLYINFYLILTFINFFLFITLRITQIRGRNTRRDINGCTSYS